MLFYLLMSFRRKALFLGSYLSSSPMLFSLRELHCYYLLGTLSSGLLRMHKTSVFNTLTANSISLSPLLFFFRSSPSTIATQPTLDHCWRNPYSPYLDVRLPKPGIRHSSMTDCYLHGFASHRLPLKLPSGRVPGCGTDISHHVAISILYHAGCLLEHDT